MDAKTCVQGDDNWYLLIIYAALWTLIIMLHHHTIIMVTLKFVSWSGTWGNWGWKTLAGATNVSTAKEIVEERFPAPDRNTGQNQCVGITYSDTCRNELSIIHTIWVEQLDYIPQSSSLTYLVAKLRRSRKEECVVECECFVCVGGWVGAQLTSCWACQCLLSALLTPSWLSLHFWDS